MSSYVARASLGLASAMRKVGSALDGAGKGMEITKYTEKLVPSTRFVAVDGIGPTVSAECFVAPSASVIGNVSIGKGSSIWYGATIRGDVNEVTIGDRTSIGDRSVVHVAKIQGDWPTHIGSGVTIGSGALVHAATLKDGCIIGDAAQVMDGAVVEEKACVAPASVVTPRTKIPAGELWAGSPAKKVRALTEAELSSAAEAVLQTAMLAQEHAIENAKDYKQILEEAELADIAEHLDESAPRKPIKDINDVLGQGHPGRIFRSTLSHPYEAGKKN